MTDPFPQLDYAPPLPLRRRKVFRRAILLLSLIVLIVCCWVMLPRYWNNALAVMQQRRWMAFTRPPTQVVFEPRGPKAQKLWTSGAGYFMRPGGVFLDTKLPGELNDALFLHARRSPSGYRRLIWISLGYVNNAKPPRFQLEGDGYIPGTIAWPAQRIRNTYADPLPVDAAGNAPRLFAGQPDPRDESHFTIRYEFEADRRSGVIHGWLRDDDTIKFEFIDDPPATTDK